MYGLQGKEHNVQGYRQECKMNYLKEELRHFINAFKFKKHHLLGLIYDIILLVIFVIAGYVFLKVILNLAFAQDPIIGLMEFINEGTRVYTSFIIGIILFFFIIIGIYSLFKFLVWNNLLNESFHRSGFAKYYFTNLLMFFILLTLQVFFAIKMGFKGLVLAVILGIIATHFNFLFKLHFIKHKSVKKALAITTKKGLKVHEFVFVYVVIAVLVYLYLFVYAILNSFILFLITPVLLVLMIFWLRHYFRQRHEF